MDFKDTIVALSTPPGSGALGVIRLSGPAAISIADACFSKDIREAKGYSLHFGKVLRAEKVLDEVLLSVFRGPHSFTREDTVEVSFHGSPYILREALQGFVEAGARLARAGEFTQRAFLNGAMDLAQAEAVADLIASSSAGAHQLALDQMRGGISRELGVLRERLLHFTSLIELELDFGEEDVEFADRVQLEGLVSEMMVRLEELMGSFQYGNAIKQGVPTVILGKPNAGKSTLLNQLLKDNRAIVSAIPGTTRDVIEDRLVMEGIEFRLMDTAGVRDTEDVIEAEGVSRSLALARKAGLVLYVFDLEGESWEEAKGYVAGLDLPDGVGVIFVGNKVDLVGGAVGVQGVIGEGQEGSQVESGGGVRLELGEAENGKGSVEADRVRAEEDVRNGLLGRTGELPGSGCEAAMAEPPAAELAADAAGRLGAADSADRLGAADSADRLGAADSAGRLGAADSADRLGAADSADRLGAADSAGRLDAADADGRLGAAAASSAAAELAAAIAISARDGQGLAALTASMVSRVRALVERPEQEVIISNVRHLEALTRTRDALLDVQQGIVDGVTGDFLSIDIRQALHHLGEITGQITTDEVLGNIFSKFCIGK